MTKQLPWVKLPTPSSTQEIGSSTYGSISLPKYGSLTPNEEIEIANYFIQLKDQSLSELKAYAATLLLKSRYDTAWTIEDTYREITSFALIEDLYNFFTSERNRWESAKYLIKIEGKTEAALETAKYYGEKVTGIVTKFEDAYFVFQSQEEYPANYDVVLNYSASGEVKPEKKTDSK